MKTLRLLFEQKIKQDPIKLNFKCSITAGAQIKKTNTFTISLKDSINFRLSDKLFGPANEHCDSRTVDWVKWWIVFLF